MSNPQGYSYSGQGGGQEQQGLPQSNPWADQVGHGPAQQQQQNQYQPEQGQYQQPNPQQHQGYQGYQQPYEPPPGPPPRRADTFETDLVPAEERSEQREALENFEMHNTKPESQTDKDVAQLQQEFPNLDGSLIAALYSDSGSLSGTREMLRELAASQ